MPGDDSIGVYYSANDAIYDWSVAFLESFRQYNPHLRLILLPFDDNTQGVEKLARDYGAEIHRDPSFGDLEHLAELVDQGRADHNHIHMFRRFASFWGPLQDFFYIDGRTLILSDLSDILHARQSAGYQLLHYDRAMDQVYNPGSFRANLIRERDIHGFMATMFASYRGLFTLDELKQYAVQLQEVRQHLNTHNADQCFLNYICDMKKVHYGGIYDVLDNTVSSAWARIGGLYKLGDRYFRWDFGELEHNKRIPLLHWAGTRRGPAMPYAHLHLHYRLKRHPAWRRWAKHLQWYLAYPPLRLARALHSNRHLNTAYHVLRNKIKGHPLPERLMTARKNSAPSNPGPPQ